jgi:hypothetical protein
VLVFCKTFDLNPIKHVMDTFCNGHGAKGIEVFGYFCFVGFDKINFCCVYVCVQHGQGTCECAWIHILVCVFVCLCFFCL